MPTRIGDNEEDLIPIHHLPVSVHQDHPITVTIQGDTNIRLMLPDLVDERLRIGGAAFKVDVQAVRLGTDELDLGTQFTKDVGGHVIGGTVGAIQHHLQALELHAHRDGALAELNVAAVGIHHALGLAQMGGIDRPHGFVQFRLDGQFHLIGELEPIGGEEFDAVVVIRIVRGANDDAGAGPHGTG